MGSTPIRHGRFALPSVATAASGSFGRARAQIAPATFLLIAIAVGVVVGRNPLVGVGFALAIVFLLAFVDVVSRNADLSLTKAAGALLAAGWAATMATRGETRRSFLSAQPW